MEIHRDSEVLRSIRPELQMGMGATGLVLFDGLRMAEVRREPWEFAACVGFEFPWDCVTLR